MEGFPTKEQIEEQLDAKVNKAFDAAIFQTEYDEKRNEFKLLEIQKGLHGTLSDEKEDRFETLYEELNDGCVTVDTLYEYRKILERGYPPEKVDSILAYENARANVAGQTQTQKFAGYKVLFTKDEDGNLIVKPFVEIVTDFSHPVETVFKEKILVGEAPRVHGEELSDIDALQIESLRKSLRENPAKKKVAKPEEKKEEKKEKTIKINSLIDTHGIKSTSSEKSEGPGIVSMAIDFLFDMFKSGSKK